MRIGGRTLAAWIDLVIPAGGAGFLLFWFFAFRLGNLFHALLLAFLLSLLLGYGLFLLGRRMPRSKGALMQKRRKAVRSIARMDERQALKVGFSALQQRYPIELTAEREGLLLGITQGSEVAVGILLALDGAGIRDVQAFDLKRGDRRGVLLVCAESSGQASAYAASLEPELVLVELTELPVPTEDMEKAPDRNRVRSFGVLYARICSGERAFPYAQSALLLLVFYILTDRWLYLLPLLLLLALMAQSAAKREGRKTLFRD